MGFEDTVINHILLIKDVSDQKIKQDDVERHVDKSLLSRRAFTVQCISNMECLSLTYTNIDVIKKDFKTPMIKFIKQNIQQTLNLLCQLIHMIENFGTPKSRVNDFCSQFNQTNEEKLKTNNKLVKQWLHNLRHEAVFEIEWSEAQSSSSSADEQSLSTPQKRFTAFGTGQ